MSRADKGYVRAAGTHFEYEDGTRFDPCGTTVYALLYQGEDRIRETIHSLENAPFNKVRFCIFPKWLDYNREEPGIFPFEFTDGKPDPAKPVEAFWDMLDRVITRLEDPGIEADLILFHPYDKWGFMELALQQRFTYLSYAVKRLAKHPNIWWCLANEYEQVTAFDYAFWKDAAAYIAGLEGEHRHLLSIHDFISPYDFSSPCFTHVALQSRDFLSTIGYQEKYGKPVIFDECGYEGNIPYDWGNLSGFDMAANFWMARTVGAYASHGETFWNPEEQLWWSKGGELKGQSVARIGYLQKLLSGLPVLSYADSEIQKAYRAGGREGLKVLEEAGTVPASFLALPDDALDLLMKYLRQVEGHYKEDVFLWYLGRQCKCYDMLALPSEGHFRVDVIDTWEMTETTVLQNVSGRVRVPLPGKEGIAILAVRD